MNRRMLIAVMLLRVIEGFGCPTHCFCYNWTGLLRTDCVKRNLFNTFVRFSYQTQVLDLSHNVLTILHGNEFLDSNLRFLQNLFISNNRLHKIDKLSFNGLDLLQILDLSHNAIEYLAPTTFRYNRSLKTLNVSYNPLSAINDGPFLSSTSLRIIDLAHCQFKFLTMPMFLELITLETLNISRNYIQKIQPEVVEMKNLKYLDISKNDLPCNNQTAAFFQKLIRRGIQFQSFCQMNQKLIVPVVDPEEKIQVDVPQGEYENVSHVFKDQQNLLDHVRRFFFSIPSVYVLLCGIHIGVFIGAIVTYLCIKRGKKIPTEMRNAIAIDSGTDRLNFALIPLNTPPGTPPSPYHSRVFTDFPVT